MLVASWQAAIHVPGAYALIQDLWVDPDCRGRAVGRELVAALCPACACAGRRARGGWSAARELRALRRDRGLLPRRGLHAEWPADADGAGVSRMLIVEQRRGPRALQPWLMSRAGLRLEGQDHDRRLSELRSGLSRHPRVRSTRADVSSGDVERTLAALHEPEYVARWRTSMRSARADGGVRRSGHGPRHASVRERRGGCVRGGTSTSRQPGRSSLASASRTRSAGPRPSRRPRLARRLLLFQQRRGSRAHPERGRRQAGGDPRPRHPLSQRHRCDRRANAGYDPLLAALLAGGKRCSADGATVGAQERVVEFTQSPR